MSQTLGFSDDEDEDRERGEEEGDRTELRQDMIETRLWGEGGGRLRWCG